MLRRSIVTGTSQALSSGISSEVSLLAATLSPIVVVAEEQHIDEDLIIHRLFSSELYATVTLFGYDL